MSAKADAVLDVNYILQHGDPRADKYPLTKSPIPAIFLALCYLIFVTIVGPLWMKHRKPYELKYPMIVYNLTMVAVSFWMFFSFGYYGWFTKYSWVCEPIDYSNTENALIIYEVCYVYYISKFIEFLDTTFMVLRKKDNQVTFLHVFHHFFMAIWCYYFVKYSGGGYVTVIGFLNSFIHTVMYSYYGLAACGPAIQKYLWWKKYLTELQFVQFILIMVHILGAMIIPKDDCKTTNFQTLFAFVPGLIFFILFIPFYREQYLNKKPKNVRS